MFHRTNVLSRCVKGKGEEKFAGGVSRYPARAGRRSGGREGRRFLLLPPQTRSASPGGRVQRDSLSAQNHVRVQSAGIRGKKTQRTQSSPALRRLMHGRSRQGQMTGVRQSAKPSAADFGLRAVAEIDRQAQRLTVPKHPASLSRMRNGQSHGLVGIDPVALAGLEEVCVASPNVTAGRA